MKRVCRIVIRAVFDMRIRITELSCVIPSFFMGAMFSVAMLGPEIRHLTFYGVFVGDVKQLNYSIDLCYVNVLPSTVLNSTRSPL